ncbi:ATP-binding protein [Streptomyces sp. NPDC001339]|uniref:ATP-binding protein n=1 Tax=Streptomyces sp. NPDC001339 TaxID=3364563 RepID=UPI0036C0F823
MTGADPGLRYLLGRVGLVVERLRRLANAAQHRKDSVESSLWDEQAALAELEEFANEAAAAGAEPRLRRLVSTFALTPADLDALLILLAPELDPMVETYYDEIGRCDGQAAASVGMVLALSGAPPWSPEARSRLGPDGRLVRTGLVAVDDARAPLLRRRVRVADRVISHLLGDDRPDPLLRRYAAVVHGELRPNAEDEDRLCYVQGRSPVAAADRVSELLAGRPAVRATFADVPEEEFARFGAAVALEVRLCGGHLVLGPLGAGSVDPDTRDDQARRLRTLTDLDVPTILYGTGAWEDRWSRRPPVLLTVPCGTPAELVTAFQSALDGQAVPTEDLEYLTATHRIDRGELPRIVAAATRQARAESAAVSGRHLRTAIRLVGGASLPRQVRRIEPAVGWADLVLSEHVEAGLRSMVHRVRYRNRVLGDWGMRSGGARGRSVVVMFSGESGTGKTLAAEAVAGELGLDLCMVNLAQTVDKYVGETEKNLERIFAATADTPGVLVFDEADALFGKRSGISNAHDRHANTQTAYLLAMLESFDGIGVLTTNLPGNIDKGFLRRLDLALHFPAPDETQRLALWDRCLGPKIPRSDDLDLELMARWYDLPGGNIRNAAVAAAYRAAAEDRPVRTADLVAGMVEEYRRLGRLAPATP